MNSPYTKGAQDVLWLEKNDLIAALKQRRVGHLAKNRPAKKENETAVC
jgi:hypothetical protein